MGKRNKRRRLWHASPWDGKPGVWAAIRRFLYQFEGAAQLGDPNEPPPVAPVDPRCPICRGLMADHRVERGGPGKSSHMICPKPN